MLDSVHGIVVVGELTEGIRHLLVIVATNLGEHRPKLAKQFGHLNLKDAIIHLLIEAICKSVKELRTVKTNILTWRRIRRQSTARCPGHQ